MDITPLSRQTVLSSPESILSQVLLIALLLAGQLGTAQAVNWPLRLSSSGKYLEDQDSKPFQIVGDAGWELTTQISDTQAITYLDDRQAKGFNAVEIRIIGHSFQTNAPNDYYNNAPFANGPNDFSVRNETYWARIDTILITMKNRGMVAIVFPAYLGYGCRSEGWCQQMLAQTTAAMTNYGQWIGNRYKNYGNIIWMTGGDANCSDYSNVCTRNDAVVNGIRTSDTDAIFSVETSRGQIGGIDSYTSVVDINAIYSGDSPQSLIQTAYRNSRPFMLQEAYYENEHGMSIANVQSQAMLTYLGGGLIGQIFGSCPLWSFGSASGYCDSSASPFDTWQHALASPGSISIGNIGKLMRSRKWWTLVPDYSNAVVTSSKGSQFSYHATAREAGGETVIVWCPDTNSVTVVVNKIRGTQAKAWWWNPDNNMATLIGTYSTSSPVTQTFTPGSARKVLILDNEASGLPAPGLSTYDQTTLSEPTNLRILEN